MRKCWLIAILLLVVGCSKDVDFEPSQEQAQNRILSGIIADEKDEDNESRVYLDNKIRIRWNKGDLISVFDGTTRNKEFVFLGSDGSSAGDFSDNSAGTIGTGKAIDRLYGLYPYASSTEYCYGEDESEADYLRYTLPATQTYKPNSMGLNANIMVAATANKSDKTLVFRNVCSYLRLKLYGADQTVSSIVFKGNTDEVLTGDVAITATYGNAPTIKMLGAAEEDNKTITLDCSEGVAIGSTSDEATEFWLVVPPVNFPNGFTITVKGEGNMGQEIVVNNNLTFARNTYNTITREVSMEELSTTTIPDNEIWYTATEKVKPYDAKVFGATLVSNTYENGKGVIKFNSTVTSIGYQAFRSCSSLTSITIPNSVTSIGSYAFYGCYRLTEITIPNSVTSIGYQAFYECRRLTSITIPNSVTSIGDWAFAWCSSLTSITIPNSVTSIGEAAFAVCSSLQKFYGKFAEDNGRCLVNDGVLIAYAEASGTEYTIPNSVTFIGECAFYLCETLTEITIPNSVTSIGDAAFRYCRSLTSVSIPNSVTSIGDSAFAGCSSITEITIPNSVTSIGYKAFSACSSLTSITIPNSVTSIGNYAFYYCSSLTEVTIGNGVTSIGNWAFAYCSITEITIPNSVTSIGNYAFAGCSSITEITIPNSVTSIGDSAFEYCRSLTEITIPNSVTSIGESAFYECSSLQKIFCKRTTPPTGSNDMFDNIHSSAKIYVPAGSGEAYKTAQYWSNYASIIEEMGVPDNEIWYTSSDGKVVEPYSGASNDYVDALKTFGANIVSNTYENGKGVIKFDGAVTSIGESAFYDSSYYSSLTSITIPNSVTSIGKGAFAGCSSITSITIPNSVTSIGKSAFKDCRSLTEIEIPNSVTSIEYDTFYNCSSLTNVSIGNGVTSIGQGAFGYCSSLTSITIPNSVTSIEESAFGYCSSLTEITIPNSVTSIGYTAFIECRSLTEITIPNSVTIIGGGTFYNCSSLQNIFCKPTTPPRGSNGMFYNIHSSAKIYVPAGSGEAYKTAEYWSDYASIIEEEESEPDDTWKIYYTATAKVEPYRENAFNVSIESNQWDSATGEGVITFNGEVNSIGSYAFYSCRNLKSIQIPENVTTIGTAAFRECFKLKDVYLNSKIESIGNSAFVGCFDFYNSTYGSINFHMNSIADWCQIDLPTEVVSGQETIYLYVNGSLIKDIDIPSSINAIKPYAFKFCYVKKITMHKDVTSIGKEAFYDSPVDAIYCKSTTPPAGCEDMFKETSLSYIYVPEGSVNSYKTAQYWSSYSSKITPYNFE